MKRTVLKILFILSIIPYVLLILGIINSYLKGFGIDNYQISSIWPARQYGYSAVKTYLYYVFYTNMFGQILIPLFLICIIYQIVYLIKLRKRKENNNVKLRKSTN